jgi:hypothetical protein
MMRKRREMGKGGRDVLDVLEIVGKTVKDVLETVGKWGYRWWKRGKRWW